MCLTVHCTLRLKPTQLQTEDLRDVARMDCERSFSKNFSCVRDFLYGFGGSGCCRPHMPVFWSLIPCSPLRSSSSCEIVELGSSGKHSRSYLCLSMSRSPSNYKLRFADTDNHAIHNQYRYANSPVFFCLSNTHHTWCLKGS